MTDDTAANHAERIRRLQERRGDGAAAKPRATPRSKHPASASRIVAVGVTLASFFTVINAFGIRQNATSTAVVPAPATAIATPAAAATPVTATAAPAPQPAPVQTATRGS